jgi:hypothetical protein
MWTCLNCSEQLDDNFEVCWNCGTSRNGKIDPDFIPERGIEVPPSLEDEIAARFQCAKCQHKEVRLKRVAVTGTGFSKTLDLQHNHFLVVSCARCGYSELYDLKILNEHENLSNILDFLFGT